MKHKRMTRGRAKTGTHEFHIDTTRVLLLWLQYRVNSVRFITEYQTSMPDMRMSVYSKLTEHVIDVSGQVNTFQVNFPAN
jgi:hypothetical protein